MKYIELTQNKKAMVDDGDFEELNSYKWSYDSMRGYAVRSNYPSTSLTKMHRQIMGEPEGMEVDHEDLDKLNNQRSNLRVATHQQNNFNKLKQKNNTSGFKGVHYHNTGWKLGKPWRARIRLDGKDYHLGVFPTPEEAAYIYDQFALQFHGEFARTNFL